MGAIEVFAGIGILLSLLVAVGGALVLVRGSYSKARMEALRSDLSDADRRIGVLEHNEERHKNQITQQAERIVHLEAQNQTLMAGLTQKAEVEAVKVMLDQHHNDAMAALGFLGQAMEHLVSTLTENGDEEDDVRT